MTSPDDKALANLDAGQRPRPGSFPAAAPPGLPNQTCHSPLGVNPKGTTSHASTRYWQRACEQTHNDKASPILRCSGTPTANTLTPFAPNPAPPSAHHSATGPHARP